MECVKLSTIKINEATDAVKEWNKRDRSVLFSAVKTIILSESYRQLFYQSSFYLALFQPSAVYAEFKKATRTSSPLNRAKSGTLDNS